MSKNRLLIFFIIFLTLGGAYYFIQKSPNKKQSKSKSLIGSNSINRFKIKNSNGEIEFKKDNDNWHIKSSNNYLADEDKIELIIKSLRDVKLRDIISENRDEFKKFKVDSDNGITVEILDNNSVKNKFIVGKTAPGYMKSYLRKGDRVYIIDKVLSRGLDISVESIRDKDVLKINKDKINKIKINNKTYFRNDDIWKVDDEKATGISNVIRTLDRLNVYKFLNENEIKDKLTDKNIAYNIVIDNGDYEKDILKLTKVIDKKVYGYSSYRDLYFELRTNRYNELKSSITGIKKGNKNKSN